MLVKKRPKADMITTTVALPRAVSEAIRKFATAESRSLADMFQEITRYWLDITHPEWDMAPAAVAGTSGDAATDGADQNIISADASNIEDDDTDKEESAQRAPTNASQHKSGEPRDAQNNGEVASDV